MKKIIKIGQYLGCAQHNLSFPYSGLLRSLLDKQCVTEISVIFIRRVLQEGLECLEGLRGLECLDSRGSRGCRGYRGYIGSRVSIWSRGSRGFRGFRFSGGSRGS